MPDQEVFDPRQGYPEGKDPTSEEEARNAYYQGFVTIWEYSQLMVGRAVITDDGYIVWLIMNVPKELLTRERMEDIKVDHLLGLGDGKTSTQIEE